MTRTSHVRFTPADTAVRLASALMFVSVLLTANVGRAQPEHAAATRAAEVLDLRRFPLAPQAEPPSQRTLGKLSYVAPSAVGPLFEFQRRELMQRGWRELEGSAVSDEYASATFSKDGYRLSVTVLPRDGQASATLFNHGNVDLPRLPVLPSSKPLFSGPVSVICITDEAPELARQELRRLWIKEGWQPYGAAGDTQFYKRNAVRIAARVATAPAQNNRTIIELQSALLSLDLPAPAGAEDLQYSEETSALAFTASETALGLQTFYRSELASSGWKPTTEKPLSLNGDETLIFRNDDGDLLHLVVHPDAGRSRVRLTYQSAERLAALDAQARAGAAKNASKAKTAELRWKVPAKASIASQKSGSLDLRLPAGTASGIVRDWGRQLRADGWKEDVATLEDIGGALRLHRDELTVSITYLDAGIGPAEVTVQVTGAELKIDEATPARPSKPQP